jgi:type IX secretion system PorP/SprF family membrane protein
LNDYVLNPAIAGSKDYFEAKSNHRFQWVGITDAPRTFILSMNGPFKFKNMGIGGYLFTDVTGPTNRTGAYASYAYHIQLNPAIKLSMGLFGGIMQYNLDATKLNLLDKGDPLVGKGVESVIIPDAGFGLYCYAEKYYMGISIPQLLQNKLKLGDTTQVLGKLKSHYYLTAGYKFDATKDLVIEPSILLKAVVPVPLQFDISIKTIYQKMVWLGLSYRTYDAMSVLIGYHYKNQLTIGYSMDFTTSDLKSYSGGTHEIMLGIRFKKNREAINPAGTGLID